MRKHFFAKNGLENWGALFKANIQRWRPLAATTEEVPRPYGRGTSSVVSFVVAMNRVDVVELVVDLVDVDLNVDLVDVDLDVVPFC